MRVVTRMGRSSLLAVLLLLTAAVVLPLAPALADEERERRRDIFIRSDAEFTPANGIRSGSGTRTDPYVISNWSLGNLTIKDTDSYVTISNNTITGRLVLDWVGDRIYVHDNDVGDLRVNQNVRRTGEATSGVITNNNFRVVGQLRHWDGVFADNVVGANRSSVFDPLFKRRAVNFDGFNGAHFSDNIIYGYMDARLHGHHHSSAFGENSHYHGAGHEAHSGTVDHSHRFHEVFITNNTIYSDHFYALAYLDTAHSANDRTAASETDESLNGPHLHHTRVHISGNELVGAGISINVFNAEDRRHTGTARGLVEIENNRMTLARADTLHTFRDVVGILVQEARALDLRVISNEVIGPEERDDDPLAVQEWWDQGAGISLRRLHDATAYLYDNRVINRPRGIQASSMTSSVRWIIRGLATENVEQDVYYDDSVENPPEKRG